MLCCMCTKHFSLGSLQILKYVVFYLSWGHKLRYFSTVFSKNVNIRISNWIGKYYTRAGTINRLINQSIRKILLIIDYKSVILIMLIIPEDILFKHVTAGNVQYGSDRKLFDHQMGGVSCIWPNYFHWF